jgi:hypothetical protein
MAFYNFVRVHETLRVTPAMEAGRTDHVWSVEELVGLALAEAPTEPPEPRPLVDAQAARGARWCAPTRPARELPNGRGILRLVGSAPAAPVAPREPEPPPAPEPRRMVQLSLFVD